MGKREIPAVEAKVVYDCDGGCDRTDLNANQLDMTIDVNDRDFSGGIVYGHKLVLCQRCASELRRWLLDRGGKV